MARKTLYLVVTMDELELPLGVFDTVREVAKYIGRPEASVKSTISHYYSGRYKNCPFRGVKVDL